jgi:hypothetical protein
MQIPTKTSQCGVVQHSNMRAANACSTTVPHAAQGVYPYGDVLTSDHVNIYSALQRTPAHAAETWMEENRHGCVQEWHARHAQAQHSGAGGHLEELLPPVQVALPMRLPHVLHCMELVPQVRAPCTAAARTRRSGPCTMHTLTPHDDHMSLRHHPATQLKNMHTNVNHAVPPPYWL